MCIIHGVFLETCRLHFSSLRYDWYVDRSRDKEIDESARADLSRARVIPDSDFPETFDLLTSYYAYFVFVSLFSIATLPPILYTLYMLKPQVYIL